jgi:transposase
MMVKNIIHQDPLSGHIFVFANRRADRLKLLYWDRDGFAIWYKRLEKGIFSLPKADESNMIDHRQLSMILEGIDISSVRLKRRFQLKI